MRAPWTLDRRDLVQRAARALDPLRYAHAAPAHQHAAGLDHPEVAKALYTLLKKVGAVENHEIPSFAASLLIEPETDAPSVQQVGAQEVHSPLDTLHLAQNYRDLWNTLAEMGLPVPEEDLPEAEAELADGDWVLWLNPHTQRWEVVHHSDVKMGEAEHFAREGAEQYAARAPAGHGRNNKYKIAGREFMGGQFIPNAVLEQATPEERQKLEEQTAKQKEAGRQKRLSRGPVDVQRLKSLAEAGRDFDEFDEKRKRRAAATLKTLLRYHGDATLHRLEEMFDTTMRALRREQNKDADHHATPLMQRIASLEHMIDLVTQAREQAPAPEAPQAETPAAETPAAEAPAPRAEPPASEAPVPEAPQEAPQKPEAKESEPPAPEPEIEHGGGGGENPAVRAAQDAVAKLDTSTMQGMNAAIQEVTAIARRFGVSPNDLWREAMYEPEGSARDIEAESESPAGAAAEPAPEPPAEPPAPEPAPVEKPPAPGLQETASGVEGGGPRAEEERVPADLKGKTEEDALAVRLLAGDKKAHEQLFTRLFNDTQKKNGKMARLAQRAAEHYPSVNSEDLKQDILAKLLEPRVYGQFDPETGSFWQFAYRVAQNEVRDQVRKQQGLVQVSAGTLQKIAAFKDMKNKMTTASHTPSDDEVFNAMKLTERQRERVKDGMRTMTARQEGLTEEGGRMLEGVAAPEKDAVHEDELAQVRDRMNLLTPEMKTVIDYLHPLGDEEPLNGQQIADKMGISREWVRRLKQQAYAILRGGDEEAFGALQAAREGAPYQYTREDYEEMAAGCPIPELAAMYRKCAANLPTRMVRENAEIFLRLARRAEQYGDRASAEIYRRQAEGEW